jgi:segregation and condensation protein A
MAAYEVSTPVYEGPFDLLLHLILRDQVDLYEVSLAGIVDSFLAEVERMQFLDLEVATEFLLIAATLVELKTRRLLPGSDDVDLDEELGLWEERDLLLARLLECKTFKDAASVLARLTETAARTFPRQLGPEEHFLGLTPDLLEGMNPERLRRAYLRAASPKPPPHVSTEHLAPIRVSVADALEEVLDEVRRSRRLSFRQLTAGLVERLEIIVRFLAILELFKQGAVDLTQAERFGDIDVVWIGDEETAEGILGTVDAYEG